MVLGSKVEGLTYPKSVYLSTSPYGFFYIKHSLAMPFGKWTEGDDRWLAGLYGLSFEKKVRAQGLGEEDAWKEYISRVEGYLRKGVPVQTYFGWTPRGEDEKEGRMVSPSGARTFWWEGLTKKTRPDTHSFVIVGLDSASDLVRINMPVGGWLGLEKNLAVPLSALRKRIEPLRQELKYTTIAYVPSEKSPRSEKEILDLVKNRIARKIEGDPDAYTGERHERYLFGVHALEGLKEDLEPANFFRILQARSEKQQISPLEILVWLKLSLYQQMFITSLAAEYLEGERMMPDWDWLSRLNILYHQLYISSMKLVSLTRAIDDKNKWSEKCKPVLREMQTTINEAIGHMKKYQRKEDA